MATLAKLGVADNTLVIFTSDNGPEVTTAVHMRADHAHDGARPWRGVKRDNWDGGHRVPFIARWKGNIAPGSTSAQTICLTDLMATCAAITGATLPDNAAEDSFNLLPVLLGKDGGRPVRDYTLHQTISLALAIRRGPWKYLDHRGSGGNGYDKGELLRFALPDAAPTAPGQLYHLATDPGETRDLQQAQPDQVPRLEREGATDAGHDVNCEADQDDRTPAETVARRAVEDLADTESDHERRQRELDVAGGAVQVDGNHRQRRQIHVDRQRGEGREQREQDEQGRREGRTRGR